MDPWTPDSPENRRRADQGDEPRDVSRSAPGNDATYELKSRPRPDADRARRDADRPDSDRPNSDRPDSDRRQHVADAQKQ